MLNIEKLKITTPIILVIIYTGLILLASSYLKSNSIFTVSDSKYINFQANFQFLILLISVMSIVTSYLLNKQNFATYFSIGIIAAPSQELKLFGIKAGHSWMKTGLSLSITISLATATFMYFQLKNANVDFQLLQGGIFWILLFSLTNSFVEEMIFRLGIVSPLTGIFSPMTIFIISAVLFGIPHLAGMPSGIIGATMAGVLGLVLAKSMYETKGLFWAWTIHFLQDVIIIGTLYLLSAKPTI